MKTLLYISGPPGAGKSTLMAALTAGCDRYAVAAPVPHEVLVDPDSTAVGAELGRRRPDFPGTDALSMSIGPAAAAWLRDAPPRASPALLLAEGDRLAHRGFLLAAATGGYRVHLVALCADQATTDARCAARASTQNPSWRAGRATKAANLAAWAATDAAVELLLLDATPPPAQLARHLREAIPALGALPHPEAPA